MIPLKSNSDDTPFLSDINMIPLIDVALVLLIIFMIITPYMVLNSLKVQLPKSASSQNLPTDNITITVNADGSVMLDNAPVAIASLTVSVRRAREMKTPPRKFAVINADKRVTVDTLVDVMDKVKNGGVPHVALTVKPKTP